MAVAAIVASACGSRTPPPYREGPIDFAYAQEGADRRLAELRGRPVVLVLVRISELPSELYLDQLVDAYGRAAGETRFLVLTVAPNEEPFLGEYVATRELPFPIGVAEWPVAAGESGLGLVPIVPTTYLVDPDGAIVELIAGGVKADELVADLKRRGWK